MLGHCLSDGTSQLTPVIDTGHKALMPGVIDEGGWLKQCHTVGSPGDYLALGRMILRIEVHDLSRDW